MRGSHLRLRAARLSKSGLWVSQGRRPAEFLFIRDLAKGTNERAWYLMERLRQLSRRPSLLSQALERSDVLTQEFQMYREAVHAPDIEQAIAAIREIEPPVQSADISPDYLTDDLDTCDADTLRSHRLPSWLVLYLASLKARTPAQADKALLDLVFSQIPHLPPQTQPSLLVMTSLALAKHSLLAPMHRVLDAFLTIPVEHSFVHFNLLLQAIARLPKSPEAAKLAVKVLETMTSRRIQLSSRTYHILLADRFVTSHLTKILRARMLEQRLLPSTAHLESYVRIFSKDGAIHNANKYMEAIRTHESRRGGKIPFSPNPDDANGSPHTANTKYIRIFGDDRASAFDYLARLIGRQAQTKETSLSVPRRPHLPATRPAKNVVDVFDWTTAFSIAARDMTTPSNRLINIFDRTLDSTTFPPTVATYTVLLRGLIRRRSYADAAVIWDRLVKERLILDRKAIGAGVKALTLAGEPVKAFQVLEAFGARPGTGAASPALVRRGPRLWKRMSAEMSPQQPIKLDTMTMNDFMVALLRIERPDMIFKVWDYMETLYDVKPDSHSLDTLCRAARLAVKLDSNTFKGSIAMLGLSNPFRKLHVEPSTREEVVQVMHAALADYHKSNARSIWKGAPAFDGVRAAFRGIILDNWPSMRNVRAPAHAVRRPEYVDGPFAPLREVAQSIGQSMSSSAIDATGQSPAGHNAPLWLSSLQSSRPASIIPSETTFQAYILLLGTSSYQHDIPLVLAWMRALQVRPSRRTLCFALIFWAEVSLRGPLFEDWAERNERSEYGRLVNWMKDWLGEKKVPTDDMVAAYLKEVAEARDSKPPRKKGKRLKDERDAL